MRNSDAYNIINKYEETTVFVNSLDGERKGIRS